MSFINKCTAAWIKSAIPLLIAEDEGGFMANRYIGDNIWPIYYLIQYVNEKNLLGLVLSLHVEKAFHTTD